MKKINLHIGGSYRDFYFGLGFLGNLLETENVQLHEIESNLLKNSYKWMPLVMYHSLAWGYIRRNEPIPFNAFDVSDWIDDLTDFDDVEVVLKINEDGTKEATTVKLQTVVRTFFKAFWESINKNVPEQKEEEQAKKKVTEK